MKKMLFHGDNLFALSAFSEGIRGRVDLVYVDPPFGTGSDFSFSFETADGRTQREMAYRDRQVVGAWDVMMASALEALVDGLSPLGVLCVHVDYRMHPVVRRLLDELLGPDHLVNDIVWAYRGGGVPRRAFARKHDNIVVYSKGHPKEIRFHPQFEPYSEASRKLVSGRGGVSIDGIPRDLARGAHMSDVWTDINALQTWSPERVGFETQKPVALLERLILAFTEPGDLVLDAFCGSGTTLVASEGLGRRWVGVDRERIAIHTARKRLLAKGAHFDLWSREDPVSTDQGGAQLGEGSRVILPSTRDVDLWAVDWNHQDGVMRPGFVAFRTRKQRDLPQVSAPWDGPVGQVAVQVVNALGKESRWLL